MTRDDRRTPGREAAESRHALRQVIESVAAAVQSSTVAECDSALEHTLQSLGTFVGADR